MTAQTALVAGMLYGKPTKLEQALVVGELLFSIQEAMGSKFFDWANRKFPWSERTTFRYLALHRNRDWIRAKGAKNLRQAYKLLQDLNGD